MRKIMVLQHVAHEPLGTLNPMLKAAGFRIRYINFGRHPDLMPSLDGYNGLIVLGGPMGVYDAPAIHHLNVEMRLLEQALKKDMPVLGICLGSQLLAHVLGSHVRKADAMELGWYKINLTSGGQRDPLFASWHPDQERVFQLHQDTFSPPRDAEHLGWSELCEGQAFRYGRKAYGLQFHLEVDRAMIHRWLTHPLNRKFLQASGGQFDAATVERETLLHIERSLALSRSTFSRFIDIFALPGKQEMLGSGHGKPLKPE